MMSGRRGNKIRQIVKLRQFVKKWRILALNRTNSRTDEVCCRSPATPPADVPEGYLAVYVGRELRRFIIPTGYLSRPLFRPFLDKAEEEFGFDHQGALTIPCEVGLFKQVLRAMEGKASDGHKNLSFEDLLNFYSKETDCAKEAFVKGLSHSEDVRVSLQKTFG